jgi:hypothetical protein
VKLIKSSNLKFKLVVVLLIIGMIVLAANVIGSGKSQAKKKGPRKAVKRSEEL